MTTLRATVRVIFFASYIERCGLASAVAIGPSAIRLASTAAMALAAAGMSARGLLIDDLLLGREALGSAAFGESLDAAAVLRRDPQSGVSIVRAADLPKPVRGDVNGDGVVRLRLSDPVGRGGGRSPIAPMQAP